MAKKIKHVPSDFSKPKAGVFHKKEDKAAPKKRVNKLAFKPKERTAPVIKSEPVKLPGKTKAGQPSPSAAQPKAAEKGASTAPMPLNKFVAHCGICSRREAADLIKKGKVKLNGLVETEPGMRVSAADFVVYDGKRILPVQKMVYYLLNKPKNMITTTDDPEGRHTVMDLFKHAPEPHVYPVGRLDRNTTGLLLLTNDGDLTQRLSHPKYHIKKIYQVTLDKPLTAEHFKLIADGLVLEDGKATVDELAFINPKNKRELGIEIHIGRNRIVRRIFEHLQYQVKALDRVMYAGLTKKNLPRGEWRELTAKEVIFLKHFK